MYCFHSLITFPNNIGLLLKMLLLLLLSNFSLCILKNVNKFKNISSYDSINDYFLVEETQTPKIKSELNFMKQNYITQL